MSAARYPVADKLILAMMVEASPFLKALRDGPDEAPAGLGEQTSITDRDPGDESRVIVVDGRMPWQKQIDAQSADIAALETEVQRLHQAHEQYVDAQRILTKNACDWRDAEIAKLRADLDRLMATTPAPSTSPTPPPHNHMANALAHSEPKQSWLR